MEQRKWTALSLSKLFHNPALRNGKPAERWGRKAMGLIPGSVSLYSPGQIARLPKVQHGRPGEYRRLRR